MQDQPVFWNASTRRRLGMRDRSLGQKVQGLAEYRLDELARRSGVSSRNIRAYQERGLLVPPKRDGRIAIYDENHLWQLQIITQLLQKGYTVAHIQDFFKGFAKNLDLADTLGVQELAKKTGMQQAFTAPWKKNTEPRKMAALAPAQPLPLDPSSELARNLVRHGLARRKNNDLVIVDPHINAVVTGAKDQTFYLRVLLGVCEATTSAVQQLAETTVNELRNKLVEHYGEGWIPPAEQQQDLAAVITDVRELASLLVNNALSDALEDNAVRAVREYLEGMMPPHDGGAD
ncbi:MerR family transcriptional regulator [Mycobacterium sp. pUA109]|uniref:MerR family transcriptional regulator n=1 Tax=Mycobacterium sp. pUA109 TaxID=3238982 RepID=UPI00351BBE87